MANGWLGLNTAVSGLRAAQQMLDVAAHNVSNASTPGYSRQRAELVASPPFSLPSFNRSGQAGQLGTGVSVVSIYRIRDAFLDGQINEQQAAAGYWAARSDSLATIESVFPEPSGSGLGDVLSKFWSSWEDVASDPTSSATRTAALAQAQSLAARFNRDSGQLKTAQADADTQVRNVISDINNLASRIASLNEQIQGVVVSGDHANDLEDQRDQLLEQLNQLVPTTNQRLADGTIEVLVGGTDLVDHDFVRTVTAQNDVNGHATPMWSSGGTVDVSTGKLAALTELRDTTIQGYLDGLNELAKGIADQVNAATTAGVDQDGNAGLALFTYAAGDEAASIAVNAALGGNPRRLVTAVAANTPGDATIAARIADLRSAGVFGTGSQTPADAYSALIGQIGTDSQQSTELTANQDLVVQQLQQRRESTSGVSLDEEATDVMRFQQAYSASARVITAIDSMLDQLINRTGRVGL